MPDIIAQIESARKNLLDLTMRNRLLNFRPTKSRSIRVVEEIPREVYNLLVIQEKVMEFKPQKQRASSGMHPSETLFTESSNRASFDDRLDDLWDISLTSNEVEDYHVDRFLQTDLDSESLQKRIFLINQQARSVFEEQGYTVLFLALGFLDWKESPDAIESRMSPLILIPVELERTNVRKSYRLKWTAEDVYSNISLHAKLAELGIVLPSFEMPEDKDGIDDYLRSVSISIGKMQGWNVVNEMFLDFFSFMKFVMYKDLDLKSWPSEESLTKHPLISAILDPTGVVPERAGFSVEEVDQRIQWRNTYHILDADPYQIAVIEDAKAGHNLVVEGPPGTGKSQTIANTIAELLANGKTVLFVSEKMAALEVVKSRLDKAGLGEFCLELHSRKSNKREVLKELERTLRTSRETSDGEMDFKEHDELREKLNGYAKALREPFGKMGYSPFRLYQLKESAENRFAKSGREWQRAKIPEPEACSLEDWSRAHSCLVDLEPSYKVVKPVAHNAWRGCSPSVILPSDEIDIREMIKSCSDSLSSMITAAKALVLLTGVRVPECLDDLAPLLHSSAVIADAPKVEQAVSGNDGWPRTKDEAFKVIADLKELQKQRSVALSRCKASAIDQDIKKLLEEFKVESARLLRILSSRYRYLKKEIDALYSTRGPQKRDQIIEELEQLLVVQNLRLAVSSHNESAVNLFGSLWAGEESDPAVLDSLVAWLTRFRSCVESKTATAAALGLIERGVNKEQIGHAAEALSDCIEKAIAHFDSLAGRLNLNFQKAFASERGAVPFSVLKGRLDEWQKGIPSLLKWSQFVRHRNACLETVAAPLVVLVDSDSINPESLVSCFEGNFADDLLHVVFHNRPNLANFVGELHERNINRFVELDQLLIATSQKRLVSKLKAAKPAVYGGATRGSEVGVLLGEFGRRRAHMPIRKLMLKAGALIQRLKPCFMMSPLSIAQFLDPRTTAFDVIIFDEASQVKPEDALGALLRGGQLVVMGDTKQLPPTSFFDHLVADGTLEDETQEATVADVESILHQCKRSFPTKSLNWHYRSRHESLIAVSNKEFYDNALLIFPSSIDKADNLGLHFIHVPDGVYDRGKSSVNRVEARRVVEAAFDHYRRYPGKSLGIGTFNIKQQQAIFEEVELQLRHDPEMEEFFSTGRAEHFFVKNLETIQGDERDVILISVGFGFDESRKLSKTFGPLNHDGGHRRLNVLATRAREKCVVFSNFRSSDLGIEPNTPYGVRALKAYLEFAEHRGPIAILGPSADAESPFEDAVYDFLSGQGYMVRKQVGCASFRIDLAVVDSKNPGRYVLGIECDGTKYHSSPVARDRDRLRQQVLEGLGWSIHRVWSTDWYRNRTETKDRLIRTVKEAVHRLNSSESTSRVKHTSKSAGSPPSTKQINPLPSEQSGPMIVPGIEMLAKPYEVCHTLSIRTGGELHEQPTRRLADAIVNVVRVEGPVHFDEVVRRIRILWGLGRSGQRIYTVLSDAAHQAIRAKLIKQKEEFLWSIGMKVPPVRRRGEDPSPQIQLICTEEIAEAAKLVLKHQFGTLQDDLVVQVSRLLGFQATHERTADRIEKVVRQLMKKGFVIERPDGMLTLSQQL